MIVKTDLHHQMDSITRTAHRNCWQCSLAIALLLFSLLANAQSISDVEAERVTRINELSVLIQQKTVQRNFLREIILDAGENASEDDRQKLNTVVEDLESLRESFLFASLGNQVDISALDNEPEKTTTWQEDFVEVIKPLADILKSVTRRPREVALLREKIAFFDQKLAAVTSAVDVASKIDQSELTEQALETLQDYTSNWQQELAQLKQNKLLAESQLESLTAQNGSNWSDVWSSSKQFVVGRGVTLILAVGAALLAWLLMRFIWWLYSRKVASKKVRRQSIFYRFAAYSYYLLTGLVVIMSVLFTLWIREDLLLLAIAFVALAGVALGFRQYVPNYLSEARLLLNLGNVREDERVVYEGLPWQVVSLNIQTVLRNPALDGVIRLPISTLATLNSRPIKNNLWFPTRKDDYVQLPDGTFGQVTCQTPDLVELSVKGGITVTYPTAEFFSLKVLNLTGGSSFGVSTTFGVDYSLQPICLTIVPQKLRESVHDALVAAGYQKSVKSELVELASAGQSSLDYLVFITLSSSVAADYFKIERLLVQTCIEAANANNWLIPFPQLTVHQSNADIVSDGSPG
jgi:small-conductance mechanosensitive channel